MSTTPTGSELLWALPPDLPQDAAQSNAATAQWMDERSRALAVQDSVTACRMALGAWSLAGQSRMYYATARAMFVHVGTGEFGAPTETGVLETLLAQNPQDLVARIALSNQHRRARRLHTAETLCRTALEQHPGNPFAMGRLASMLAEQGAVQGADALFREVGARFGGVEAAIRLAPDFLHGSERIAVPQPDPLVQIAAPAQAADFIVLAGGDAGYFHRFADALANSLARSCHGVGLHLHVVDPDAAVMTRIQAMRDRLPGMSIALTVETCPVGLPHELRTTFFACARFLHLPRLLAAYAKPVLSLDIDMVVLRDVAPLLNQFAAEQADLALVHGETRDPWCALWADAVLVAPSERGAAYAALVRDYIAHFIARGEAAWFLDQIALFAAAKMGFRDRAAPVTIAWPSDIQNTRTDLAYFWSLHMSQPNNVSGPETELYRRFKENAV